MGNHDPRWAYSEEDVQALIASPRFLAAADAYSLGHCTLEQMLRLAFTAPPVHSAWPSSLRVCSARIRCWPTNPRGRPRGSRRVEARISRFLPESHTRSGEGQMTTPRSRAANRGASAVSRRRVEVVRRADFRRKIPLGLPQSARRGSPPCRPRGARSRAFLMSPRGEPGAMVTPQATRAPVGERATRCVSAHDPPCVHCTAAHGHRTATAGQLAGRCVGCR
jgi:hypothetical protein